MTEWDIQYDKINNKNRYCNFLKYIVNLSFVSIDNVCSVLQYIPSPSHM